MLLNNIRLKNYRKFRDEFIEFPRGILGIIGRNGVGKSTIFEAIGWVLYGSIMSRSGKDEIKSQNASEEEICRAELEFSLGGHNYKIIRELKGKSPLSNAFIFVDGSNLPEVARDSEVNKYVEKLLGMDYVTFMRSVYAKQKELGSLSILTRAERQKVIRRMLNIDKIDLAVDAIRIDKRDKQEFIKGVKFKLEDMKTLKQQQNNTTKEIGRIKERIGALAIERAQLKKKKDRTRKSREKQEALYKKHNEIMNSISKLSSKLEGLTQNKNKLLEEEQKLKKEKQTLATLEPKEELYEKKKRQKEAMDELKLRHNRKNDLKRSVKEKQEDIKTQNSLIKKTQNRLLPLKDIDRKYKKVQKELKQTKRKKEAIAGDIKEIIKKESVFKSKIEELSEKKAEISSLGPDSKCPVCFRRLGKTHKDILKHFEKEITKIKGEYQKITNIKGKLARQEKQIKDNEARLEKHKDALNKKLARKSGLEAKLQNQKQELSKATTKLAKEKSELKSLAHIKFNEVEYKELKTELESLYKTRDEIIRLRKDVSRLPQVLQDGKINSEAIVEQEKELRTQKTARAELKFDEGKHEKIKRTFEQASDELSECETNLEREEGNLRVKDRDLKAIKDKIMEQKTYRVKIKTTQTDIQYLERLESLVSDFRNELINRIRPLLTERASYLFKELTDGRYPLIELDEDYNIYIVDGNQKYGLKRYSGGEEDLANLCLRIAMSQVIGERSGAPINFMALDEIFGSQDESRRSNILNAFNKLTNQFAQIILITHIDTIREKLQHVLKIEEDSNKESHAQFE